MWGIDFLMMARDGKPIRCNVMRTALRETVREIRRRFPRDRQLSVFDVYREKLESVASQKYDCSLLEDGIVFVRPGGRR